MRACALDGARLLTLEGYSYNLHDTFYMMESRVNELIVRELS